MAITPRRWQVEALAAWNRAGRKGVVEVVTGAGKTVFAHLCMAAVREDEPGAVFVVAVPTQALLDQWYVGFLEDLEIDEADIALWSAQGIPDTHRRYNIMVINTARWAAPKVAAASPAMLIVDECHRIGSPANAEVLAGRHIATLGMSATPEREYDDAFNERIAPAIGGIIYRLTVNEGIADGILVPFELINVAVDLLADERDRYEKMSKQIARVSRKAQHEPGLEERLKLLLRQRARVAALASMRVPVAIRLIEQHRGERALVFHEDINQAELLLANLKRRRHSATIYHSRIGPSVRRDNLRLFRRGIFDVLVSCRALDEGFNIPEARVAVIASATASQRQRIQRLGRVIRPARGKDSAIVYTIYATTAEERRLQEEADRLTSARSVTWQRSKVRRVETAR